MRLFAKLDEQRQALGSDKVFDVLGEAFAGHPFVRTEFGDFEATGITGRWAEMWARGKPPW
jgi:hypothetical protein